MSIETYGAKTLENLDFANAQSGQRVRGTNRLYVRFYNKTENQVYAKEFIQDPKTGSTKVLKTDSRPITREWVEIITPGDKNNVIDTLAEDFHKREHMKEYLAFREGRTAPVGNLLENCSYIAGNLLTELKVMGVHTEEQLSEAPDAVVTRISGGDTMRKFAKESVKAKQANKENPALQMLQAQLVEAMEKIKALEGKDKVEVENAESIKTAPKKEKNLGPINLKVKENEA